MKDILRSGAILFEAFLIRWGMNNGTFIGVEFISYSLYNNLGYMRSSDKCTSVWNEW